MTSWESRPPSLLKLALVISVSACGATALGCRSNTVITATGTTIGVEIAENPATHVPHAKLGYNRAEVAFVPTNSPGAREPGPQDGKITGAQDTAEVLMELKYAGIFSWGASGGIYQRLAVGKTAVKQPGAAFMFARDASGELNPQASADIRNALLRVPSAPDTALAP